MIEKIEIDENTELFPGDEIELVYNTFGPLWIQATQVALIERRLKDNPRYFVRSITPTGNTLVFRVQIIKPGPSEPEYQEAGIGVTVAVIAKWILVAGLIGLVWLSLDKVYKIVETPAGKIGVAGIGVLGLAVGIAAFLTILKSLK